MNLTKIKSTLLECLEEAGILLKAAIKDEQIIEKKSELSLVTETDKNAERIVIGAIRRDFPDHTILTEESPPSGSSSSRWIIDPLDGTTNFAHRYPVACVSIAFEHEGELQVGGIYDPFRDELFFAERGKGATLNQKPIQVSKAPNLAESLFATGFPYDRRERPDQYLTIVKDFMMKIQGIRRSGAAALDLAYVACGRLDGFWEFQLQPWDKAAAMIILEEAGGQSTDFKGNKLTLEGTQNLATNGLMHEEALAVLNPYQDLVK